MSLAYLVDNPNELILVGDNGQVACLSLNLYPVDEDGEELDEDHEIFEEFIDDPQDLFGKKINFVVKIGKIDLKVDTHQDLYVTYNLKTQGEDESMGENMFETGKIKGV